ncbi:hypothetical protein CL622_03435 [archaeon]|nr:hypothetical protein [archaeon]
MINLKPDLTKVIASLLGTSTIVVHKIQAAQTTCAAVDCFGPPAWYDIFQCCGIGSVQGVAWQYVVYVVLPFITIYSIIGLVQSALKK